MSLLFLLGFFSRYCYSGLLSWCPNPCFHISTLALNSLFHFSILTTNRRIDPVPVSLNAHYVTLLAHIPEYLFSGYIDSTTRRASRSLSGIFCSSTRYHIHYLVSLTIDCFDLSNNRLHFLYRSAIWFLNCTLCVPKSKMHCFAEDKKKRLKL